MRLTKHIPGDTFDLLVWHTWIRLVEGGKVWLVLRLFVGWSTLLGDRASGESGVRNSPFWLCWYTYPKINNEFKDYSAHFTIPLHGNLVGLSLHTKDLYLMMSLNLTNLQALVGCPFLSHRPRMVKSNVRSAHQCTQTPHLLARLTATPIWDKTENKAFMKTASFHMKIGGFHMKIGGFRKTTCKDL